MLTFLLIFFLNHGLPYFQLKGYRPKNRLPPANPPKKCNANTNSNVSDSNYIESSSSRNEDLGTQSEIKEDLTKNSMHNLKEGDSSNTIHCSLEQVCEETSCNVLAYTRKTLFWTLNVVLHGF